MTLLEEPLTEGSSARLQQLVRSGKTIREAVAQLERELNNGQALLQESATSDVETELTEIFMRLSDGGFGPRLSESAARVAARGRAR